MADTVGLYTAESTGPHGNAGYPADRNGFIDQGPFLFRDGRVCSVPVQAVDVIHFYSSCAASRRSRRMRLTAPSSIIQPIRRSFDLLIRVVLAQRVHSPDSGRNPAYQRQLQE